MTDNPRAQAETKAREWCKRFMPHAKKIAGVTPKPGVDYPQHEHGCDMDNCAWPFRVQSLTDLILSERKEAEGAEEAEAWLEQQPGWGPRQPHTRKGKSIVRALLQYAQERNAEVREAIIDEIPEMWRPVLLKRLGL